MKLKITPELAAFVIGFVLFSAGVYFIYPPGALLASGAILMGISIFGEKR